jgi:membrane protease YdiL (CAAX protease family)
MARIGTLLAMVAVMAVNRWPQWRLNGYVRALAGHPGYRGPWLLVEHFFLSGSLAFAVSVIAWRLLAARGHLPPIRSLLGARPLGRIVAWGVVCGLLPLAINFAVMAAGGIRGMEFGFVPPSGWLILGNLVSNFYEELVFRGFFLVGLRFALGNTWAALILSSFAHGMTHEQYPLEERLMMSTLMILWAWAVTRTRSLWTPWIGHELVDLIGDSVVKGAA